MPIFAETNLNAMKKYFSLLLLVLLAPAILLAQEEEEINEPDYASKEKDSYYQERIKNYKPWEPMDISEIQAYKNPFFEVKEIKKYTPYKESEEHQKYYYESLKPKFASCPELASKVGNKQIVKYGKKTLIHEIIELILER